MNWTQDYCEGEHERQYCPLRKHPLWNAYQSIPFLEEHRPTLGIQFRDEFVSFHEMEPIAVSLSYPH